MNTNSNSWIEGFLSIAKCVLMFPTSTFVCVCEGGGPELASTTGFLCIIGWAVCTSATTLWPVLLQHQFVFFPLPLSLSAQLTKAHRQGHVVKVDWLDRLTFREIEMINEVSQLARTARVTYFDQMLTETKKCCLFSAAFKWRKTVIAGWPLQPVLNICLLSSI